MQLFQNPDAADHPFGVIFRPQNDAGVVENFLLGHNRLPLEAWPKLAATGRFRTDLRR